MTSTARPFEPEDEIFAACELDFSDIRLIDSNTFEVPYVIRQAFVSETDALSRYSPLKIATLIESDNGSIEVTVFGVAVIVMVIIMAFILFQTLKRQEI